MLIVHVLAGKPWMSSCAPFGGYGVSTQTTKALMLLSFGQLRQPRIISGIDTRCLKALASVVVLVLSLGAFLFPAKEAQAQKQPTTVQEDRTVGTDGPVHERASEPPSSESLRNEITFSNTTSMGSTSPPATQPGPLPQPETQPEPAPTPVPEPAPAPAPEPGPPPTGDPGSTPEPGPQPLPEPAPEPGPLPPGDDSGTPPDPTPSHPGPTTPAEDPSSEDPSPGPGPEPHPVPPIGSTPSSKPAPTMPRLESVTPGRGNEPAHSNASEESKVPSSWTSEGEPAAPPASPRMAKPRVSFPGHQPSKDVALPSQFSAATSAAARTGRSVVPSSVGVTRALPALRASATNAVKMLHDAATDVANVLGSLLGGSAELPSDGADTPSKDDAPPPSTPFLPPIGGSFFSLVGGGQVGIGSGTTPLLLGMLILGLVLLRPDGKRSRVFCEMPKPSSALLLPLERPG
jgi:hypothetical protein